MSLKRKITTLLFVILFSIPTVSFPQGKTGGVHGIEWGTSFEEVLEHFRELAKNPETAIVTTILNVRPDTEILIKRDEIKYRYYFYQRPDIVLENKSKEVEAKPGAEDETFDSLAEEATDDIPADSTEPVAESTGEANKAETTDGDYPRFFFMETKFSYVPSPQLLELLTKRYGSPTLEKIDKKGIGAYVWEMDTGYIVQWVDIYDKKPFTRSLYYISKEIMKEINQDYEKYKYTREINVLRKILP